VVGRIVCHQVAFKSEGSHMPTVTAEFSAIFRGHHPRAGLNRGANGGGDCKRRFPSPGCTGTNDGPLVLAISDWKGRS